MSLKRCSQISLYIFYGLLAYMPVHIFLSTWLGTSWGVLEFAKIAKDIALFGGFLFAFCASLGQRWLKGLVHDRLIWLIVGYALLTVFIAAVRPTDSDAEILGVVYNLRFILFFVYGLLLTRLFPAKSLQTAATKIVLSVAAVVVAFGIFQYIALPDDALTHVGYSRANGVLPAFFIDDKPDLERVMSTIRDPNSLGSYLIIIGPLAAATWLKQKQRRPNLVWMGFVGLTALCVGLTFSRSAWIGFVLAMACFAVLNFQDMLAKHKRLLAAGLASVVLIGVGSVLAFRNSYFVQNTILHADDSTVLEDPNQLRVRFFRESVEDITSNPLGDGPGTAGLASIRNNIQGTRLNENYYLQIASEAGVAGLLLFLAILIVVAQRLWSGRVDDLFVVALFAGFVGLAVTNFLVHIWSNEAVAYTWWGLAGVFLGMQHGQKGRKT